MNKYDSSFFVTGGGEILDDILRHGSHDVIWCYIFERMVAIYANIKTNHKDHEISFVNFQRRSLFTWIFGQLQVDRDRLLPPQRALLELHKSLICPEGYVADKESYFGCPTWHKHGLLKVSSMDKAKELWSLSKCVDTHSLCLTIIEKKGIIIGSKKPTYRDTSNEERRFFIHYLSHNILRVGVHQKVMFKGVIYQIGDNVVVSCDTGRTPIMSVGHWKAHINSFFSVQHEGELKLFFGANYYNHIVTNRSGSELLEIDSTTGMSVLQSKFMDSTWDSIRPIESLLHKFVPFQHGSHIIAYETKDISIRERLVQPGCIGCIPPWLEEDDIILMKANSDPLCFSNTLKHAVVRVIDCHLKQLKVAWLGPIREGKWKVVREDDEWHDWWLCVSIQDTWQVIKRRNGLVMGEVKALSVLWQS